MDSKSKPANSNSFTASLKEALKGEEGSVSAWFTIDENNIKEELKIWGKTSSQELPPRNPNAWVKTAAKDLIPLETEIDATFEKETIVLIYREAERFVNYWKSIAVANQDPSILDPVWIKTHAETLLHTKYESDPHTRTMMIDYVPALTVCLLAGDIQQAYQEDDQEKPLDEIPF